MEIFFIGLAIILLVAFLLSYLFKALNQPIIVGYIIAGIIISPFFLQFGVPKDLIDIFSKFGIAFLLFMVGLHLNPKIVKEIGTTSLIVGFGQMALTFFFGFLIAYKFLNFYYIESMYIGIALSFSSTIIIMKLFSDKNQLDSLFGKISIGVLIIQDLVAVAVLMFISSMNGGMSFSALAAQSLLGGGIALVLLFFVGFFILPRVTNNIAKSQELLFLFSICWCFLIAALFNYLGFSIEIGALLAGVSLSISPYSSEISSKVRPLRDFFLIIFFIILGLNINLSDIRSIIPNVIIFSFIALILKPLIIMVLMAVCGYTKRTNFLVGTSLGQISEFSLIILLLGVSLGQIEDTILSTITLTGIITITLSTYMIIYSEKIYSAISESKLISMFERRKIREKKEILKKYDIILFGYNRTGFSILNSLKCLKKNYLVVDFNPDTVKKLERMGIPALYGDASDAELLDELPLEDTEMVISTVPDFETNMILVEQVRHVNSNSIIIARASNAKDALHLYNRGANHVFIPYSLGGEYVSKIISQLKTDKKNYNSEREKHIKALRDNLGKETNR